MGFDQELHQTARSREIERTFRDNREAIIADIENLELTMRDIAKKWNVNDRNVRRFAERVGIDLSDRVRARRLAGYEQRKPSRPKTKKDEDGVRNPALLSMKW